MSHEEVVKMIQHNEEDFEVKQRDEFGGFVIMRVFYPQCPNGDKIMVFRSENAPPKDALFINPHFGDEDNSPCARFEPTDEGWAMAIAFVRNQIVRRLNQ